MGWVDYLVAFCAGFELVCFVITVVGGPLMIGKPRSPMSGGYYIIQFLMALPIPVIAGRCLGWW